MTILDAMTSPALFGPFFESPDWRAWKAFLGALYGLPLGANLRSIAATHTQRTELPPKPAREAWMCVGRRGGKALDVATPILTPSGWTTMGALRVGDFVYGPDGMPTRVIATTDPEPNRPTFDVNVSGGDRIRADAEHEWVTYDREARRNARRRRSRVSHEHPLPLLSPQPYLERIGARFGWLRVCGAVGRYADTNLQWQCQCACGRYVVRRWCNLRASSSCGCGVRTASVGPETRTTAELYATQSFSLRESNHAIRAPLPIAGDAPCPIPPYTLGAWLGDGHSAGGSLTSADSDVVERIRCDGFEISKHRSLYGYGILGLHRLLREQGLIHNKHIPRVYLRASVEDRLELLRGLMDTDGYAAKTGKVIFYSTNRTLAEGAVELVRSLGWEATIAEGRAKLYGKDCGPKFAVYFKAHVPVFHLTRKAERQSLNTWRGWRHVRSVVPGPPTTTRCIQVEREDGLFLVGRSLIPTHNSRIAALLATYTACFRDYHEHLAPGELARIPVIAADMDQAGAIFGYVRGFLESIPALRVLVKGKITGHRVELLTGVEIIVRAATFRGLRSRPTPLILADEIAFWRNEESANPDHEILRALRPGMLTIPGAMLIGLSSPYARKGVLWEAYRKYYGQNDPRVLVWRAGTLDMNPGADAEGEITRAYEEDPLAAAAEYGGEFRRDLEAYISLEILDAITERGVRERAPVWGYDYVAFCDPSGGSQDSMTLAIAHAEGETMVLDCLVEKRPPFSPDAVVAEFAGILKRYKIPAVRGDRYAGEWPRERFAAHGIGYDPCDETKSELYLQALPYFTAQRVKLLDQPRLLTQLGSLDRRTARGGRDSIDHPPGAHDDCANAAVGALLDASRIGTAPQATNLARSPVTPIDWSDAP